MYPIIILFSDISILGYWTDFILLTVIIISNIIFILKSDIELTEIDGICSRINYYAFLLIIAITIGSSLYPNQGKGFHIQSTKWNIIDNKLVNLYFTDMTSESNKSVKVWITISSEYFPIIEKEVYKTDENENLYLLEIFNKKEIDKQKIKDYIKDMLILKK
jgi:hypothetical protein